MLFYDRGQGHGPPHCTFKSECLIIERKGDFIMLDYGNLTALCSEVDRQQAAGQVSQGKAYALMCAFDDYLSTVKPTGYEISYSPMYRYQVTYYENGERVPANGWVYGFNSYGEAATVQWALMDAYNAGRRSMGGNNNVF